jgi:hypothetical protein
LRQKKLIEKRRQLITFKSGVYWVLAKWKKRYSKISKELHQLLIDAFNDHPHVIMSPNAKDTLLAKDMDGENVSVQKILMQVGMGTILLDIVRDNPTIKHKVGEQAF